MTNTSPKRKEQISKSVKKHRATRDRLEVYIPKGWREELRIRNSAENLTTSDWIRKAIALRIGKDI
jgi:hypothetical protein